MQGAARIHAILAREAATAVVFRRGPSKRTAVIEWNLKTDTFKVGQWFYGSFYPYRCDLSPDGRHLVYFAAKYGRSSTKAELIQKKIEAEIGPFSWNKYEYYRKREKELEDDQSIRSEVERRIRAGEYNDCSWTAVSRAPYLKALSLWFNGSGWNGGGLFVDNRRLALNHPPFSLGSIVRRGGGAFQEVSPPEYCKSWGYAGECPMVYVPRLMRDGWTMLVEDRKGWLFEKPLLRGMKLQKLFLSGQSGPNHGCYWEQHAVVDADGKTVFDGADWSWADYDRSRRRIVLAENGVLYELRITGTDLRKKRLRDFNDMVPERLTAPY